MNRPHPAGVTVFGGPMLLATGDLKDVVIRAKQAHDRFPSAVVLIFDNETSEIVEVDYRGTPEEVVKRVAAAQAKPERDTPEEGVEPGGRGRPKLGVVAREVTLLPRHWDWLNRQPGGASAALRRLVEQARRTSTGEERVRRARESAYRFMTLMAGNESGYEEACRALFAGNRKMLHRYTSRWPADVADHARWLAEPGVTDPDSAKMPA